MGNFLRLLADDIAESKNGVGSRIGKNARVLLHDLISYANKKGESWVSLKTLAEKNGLSTDTLERAARELKTIGQVGIKYDKGPRSGEIWILAFEAKRYVNTRLCDTWYFTTTAYVSPHQPLKQQQAACKQQIEAVLDQLPHQESRELLTDLYKYYGVGIDAPASVARRTAQQPSASGVVTRKPPEGNPHPAGYQPAPCGLKQLSEATSQKQLSEASTGRKAGPSLFAEKAGTGVGGEPAKETSPETGEAPTFPVFKDPVREAARIAARSGGARA